MSEVKGNSDIDIIASNKQFCLLWVILFCTNNSSIFCVLPPSLDAMKALQLFMFSPSALSILHKGIDALKLLFFIHTV